MQRGRDGKGGSEVGRGCRNLPTSVFRVVRARSAWGEEPEKVSRPLLAACRRATLRVQGAPGRVSDRRGGGVRHGIGHGRRGFRTWDATRRRLLGAREGYVGTSRGGRRRVSESRRRYPNRDGLSRAAHGRYAHGAAGGEAALHAERLRCCAARPSEEGGRLLTGINEKDERRELLDAVADAGRLARGLDQLLESMAHADQLDPLDVEGILALRSISERCAERIEDAARILEAAERGLLCRTLNAARRKGTLRSRRGSRRVARPASSILAGARNWGALGQLSPLMVSSSSTM